MCVCVCVLIPGPLVPNGRRLWAVEVRRGGIEKRHLDMFLTYLSWIFSCQGIPGTGRKRIPG